MKTNEFTASKGEGLLFKSLLSSSVPANVIDDLEEKFKSARKQAEEMLAKARAKDFPSMLKEKDLEDPQVRAIAVEAYGYIDGARNVYYLFNHEVVKMYFEGDYEKYPMLTSKSQVPENVYMAMAKALFLQYISDLVSCALYTGWNLSANFLPKQYEELFMKLGIITEPIVKDKEELSAEESYAKDEHVESRAGFQALWNRPPSLELLDY